MRHAKERERTDLLVGETAHDDPTNRTPWDHAEEEKCLSHASTRIIEEPHEYVTFSKTQGRNACISK